MNKAFTTTALAIAASVSTTLYAQSTDTTELDPIIVSGGISPISADEFGRSNTIITREQIEDRGYSTVQQALEAQPGISINGDGPSNRQVRIRGGEGNHTLILIDGVRAASGDNEYYLRGLGTGYVERIEILRGPQSVPFGTDASSGVINIITREAGEGWGYGGAVQFGEGDEQNAYVSNGGDAVRFSLSASNVNDKGFDYSGGDGRRDETRWQSLFTKGELDLAKDTTASFSFRFSDSIYDVDDFDNDASSADGYVVEGDGETERAERAGSLELERFSSSRNVGHKISFDRTSNQNSASSDTTTDVVSYRLQFAIDGKEIAESDDLLSVLLENREDVNREEDSERDNFSLAAEYQSWLSERLSFQGGIRQDRNSEFSDATTWNLAGSYYLNRDLRLHASGGRAVVNPSFLSIYGGEFQFPGFVFVQDPNPDLTPEKNVGFDVGLEVPFPRGGGYVDFTYFKETLEDKISFDGDANKDVNRDGKSDRQGLEVSARLNLHTDLDVTLNYTYLDATTPEGEIEIRRPRNELGLGFTSRLPDGATTLSGDLRYVRGLVDQQFWEDDSPRERLPDFTVVNFAATHALTEQVELTARITNAFDEEYSEVWGYATRGRAGFVGLRASW